jgi:hypothetical protein
MPVVVEKGVQHVRISQSSSRSVKQGVNAASAAVLYRADVLLLVKRKLSNAIRSLIALVTYYALLEHPPWPWWQHIKVGRI